MQNANQSAKLNGSRCHWRFHLRTHFPEAQVYVRKNVEILYFGKISALLTGLKISVVLSWSILKSGLIQFHILITIYYINGYFYFIGVAILI